YRVDELLLRPFIDFLTQIVDVDIDHVGHRIRREFPYVLDDHVAGDAASGVAHEVFEKTEFLGSKFDGPAASLDGTLNAIQPHVLNLQNGLDRTRFAPQHRPRPG